MAHEIKIAIVEDELLIAENIRVTLEEIGYQTCEPVSGYAAALEMFKLQKPDLVLLDINLGGDKDGIDIARQINEHYHLPFIFLTANSDRITVERAKEVKPYAYLVKPFTQEELFASIEIAINNFNLQKPATDLKENSLPKSKYLFSWDGHRFVKIQFSDILFVESRENYVYVHTSATSSIAFRSTSHEFLSRLPSEKFFRVHRSYVVQTDLIENIDYATVTIAGVTIPVGKTYRDDLFMHLGIEMK